MGIEGSILRVRGEIDENVFLTNCINSATEEQLQKVLKTLRSECLIEAETTTKYDLIKLLKDFPETEKEKYLERIENGEWC